MKQVVELSYQYESFSLYFFQIFVISMELVIYTYIGNLLRLISMWCKYNQNCVVTTMTLSNCCALTFCFSMSPRLCQTKTNQTIFPSRISFGDDYFSNQVTINHHQQPTWQPETIAMKSCGWTDIRSCIPPVPSAHLFQHLLQTRSV